MTIAGVPGTAFQGSRSRAQTAVKNSGLYFPRHRMVVNLAAATIHKDSPLYDLPIALGAILLLGLLPHNKVENTMVIGELSLDGVVRHLRGFLPMADGDCVMRVLTNLTGNALQYTSEDGRITLSAKQVGNEIQISIRDTGIRISSEYLTHIFDRFYRVDKPRSRKSGGGSGIGLTIARSLVETHGGRIWVESAGGGQGSMFTFTLPI